MFPLSADICSLKVTTMNSSSGTPRHVTSALCVLLTIGLFSPLVYAVPITGFVFGEFNSPFPASPPSVTTGIGTNSVSFGIPCDGVTNCLTSPGGVTPPNSLLYDPFLFTTEIGENFEFGTMEFFNGAIQPGTEISRIRLNLELFEVGVGLGATGFRFLDIVNTTNSADPVASADFVSIAGGTASPSSFHVAESESAVATLVGRITDGGVVTVAATSSLLPLAAAPSLELEVLAFGRVLSGPGFISAPVKVHAVSEPSTFFLFSIGVIGVIALHLSGRNQTGIGRAR